MHILAEPLDVGVGRLVLQPFTSGGITTMMGIKERNFRPLPDDLSLEVMVPRDNFYRRLEERIDLSFVRELVLPLYAKGGRHSIDPVVFFKLQLVLFFENTSEASGGSWRWWQTASPSGGTWATTSTNASRITPASPRSGNATAPGIPPLLREDRRDVRRGR